MKILVLNSGSSSQKTCILEIEGKSFESNVNGYHGPELRVAMPEFDSKSRASAPRGQAFQPLGQPANARIQKALKEANE